MGKRLFISVVLLALVLWAGTEVLLPALVAKQVERAMIGMLAAQQASAKVVTHPAVGLLTGRLSNVTVEATGARFDKLTVSQFSAVFRDLQVDPRGLLAAGTVQVQHLGGLDATFVFNDQDLAAYLNQTVKGFKNITVTSSPNQVQVTGQLAAGLASLQVTLDGRVVGEGTQLKFVTERFLLNGTAIAGGGGSRMLAEIPLADLSRVPFPLAIREVVMDQGRVVVRAGS